MTGDNTRASTLNYNENLSQPSSLVCQPVIIHRTLQLQLQCSAVSHWDNVDHHCSGGMTSGSPSRSRTVSFLSPPVESYATLPSSSSTSSYTPYLAKVSIYRVTSYTSKDTSLLIISTNVNSAGRISRFPCTKSQICAIFKYIINSSDKRIS